MTFYTVIYHKKENKNIIIIYRHSGILQVVEVSCSSQLPLKLKEV